MMPPSVLLLLQLLFITVASTTDLLQNANFESPPLNIPANSSISFQVLNQSNPIPGWSFQGTVWYVTAGPNISLPGEGHAVQLREDGKINQTFKANGNFMQYILTFTLAPGQSGDDNCSTPGSVMVVAPDRSPLFSLEQRYGKEAWESHACYLGSWGDEREPINLVLQTQSTEADPNVTCWPVIDTLIIKKIGLPAKENDNLLINGGFEVGPAFLSNSTEGILLDAEPSLTQSALQQWSVIGTVKYIDSGHYLVPQGNAAIEIVSGASAGIQTATELQKGSTYSLEFVVGDSNTSCIGDFIVGVQAGSKAQNFTHQSNGTGSAQNFSMTFKADSSPTPISFLSFTTSQTKDFGFCGPVIDNVVLRSSYGLKLKMRSEVLFSCLVFLVAVLQFIV